MQKSACLNRKARRREAALNRKRGKFFSKTLVNTVAAGAIGLSVSFMMDGHEARAQFIPAMGPVTPADPQCAVSGTSVTCTGDLEAGVFAYGPAYDTLNVNNLTGQINSQFDGVGLANFGAGNVKVNVDSGYFGIVADQDGIYGRTSMGDVSITNGGNVTSLDQEGIDAEVFGNGSISINSAGTIVSEDASIEGTVTSDGDIDIISVGDLTSNDDAIDAFIGGSGNISITNTGDIEAEETGIHASNGFFSAGPDGLDGTADDIADGGNGNITINNTGDITSGDGGIYAYVDGDGNILINQTGNIHAEDYGIYGGVDGTGNVSISIKGDITIDGVGPPAMAAPASGFRTGGFYYGYGIQAFANDGNITLDVDGGINVERGNYGEFYGIDVFAGQGDININVTGDVTVEGTENETAPKSVGNLNTQIVNVNQSFFNRSEAYGIQASTRDGNVMLNVTGDVTSTNYAIRLGAYNRKIADKGNIGLTVNGDIASERGNGILAYARNDVSVNISGTIDSYFNALQVLTQDGNVQINTSGDIETRYGSGISVGLVNYPGYYGNYANNLVGNVGPGPVFNPFIENSVNITNTGDILTEQGVGIGVIGYSGYGFYGRGARANIGPQGYSGLFVENTVNITNSGNIEAGAYGILVGSYAYLGGQVQIVTARKGPAPFFSPGLFDANDISIVNSGDINSEGGGIFVGSYIRRGNAPPQGQLAVRNLVQNNIMNAPVFFPSGGVFFDSNVSIVNSGDVTSEDEEGLFVGIKNVSDYFGIPAQLAGAGNMNVAMARNVIATPVLPPSYTTFGQNEVSISNSGDITSTKGSGIFVGVDDSNGVFGQAADARANNIGVLPAPTGTNVFGENSVVILNTGNIRIQHGTGIFVGISSQSQQAGLWPLGSQLNGFARGPSNGFQSSIFGGNEINIDNSGDIKTTNGNGITVGFSNAGLSFMAATKAPKNTMKVGYPKGLVPMNGAGVFGNNTVTINNDGNITTDNGNGISVGNSKEAIYIAHGNNGVANVAVRPGPEFNPGLFNGNEVKVTNSGNVTATNGHGVYIGLYGSGKPLPILDVAFEAVEYSGNKVSITNSGNIQSTNGAGIFVGREGGDVDPMYQVYNQSTSLMAAAMNPVTNTPSSTIITNSGLLSGGNGFAIDLRGDGNDVINLLPGSIIDGAVDFGNGNDGMGGFNPNDIDTLNVSAGVNAVIEFADNSGFDSDFESAPENINFAGGGVVINTGMSVTAVAVDATEFAGQGTFISDFADSIFNSIDNGGTSQTSGIDPQGVQGFGAIGEENRADGVRLWGSLFGGHHNVEADGNTVEFDHDFFGLASGIEKGDVETDGVLGILGGYGRSNLSTAFNVSDTEIDSYFGGVYWKRDFGSHRIHAAFIAGATDNETTRFVNGMEAKGDFDGTFYSPSVTLSAPLDMFATPMSISGRASYVHLDLDGYTETGVALPLAIADRDVSIFNLRGQLNVSQFTEQSNGNTTRVNWAIGVDATIDAGSDDVTAVVAATPFSFGAETQDDTAGFVGLNIAHTTADGARTLGFNGELQSTFNGGIEATGELSAGFRF